MEVVWSLLPPVFPPKHLICLSYSLLHPLCAWHRTFNYLGWLKTLAFLRQWIITSCWHCHVIAQSHSWTEFSEWRLSPNGRFLYIRILICKWSQALEKYLELMSGNGTVPCYLVLASVIGYLRTQLSRVDSCSACVLRQHSLSYCTFNFTFFFIIEKNTPWKESFNTENILKKEL